MRPLRACAAGVTWIALTLAHPAAYADANGSDAAVAQGLFDAARSFMAEGRYAEACPKLEESLRLDHGIGTQYHLADCYEHVGKTASAWAAFLQVAAQAKASGQADREKVARARAQKLEARVPRVVISIAKGERAHDLVVRRDGDVVTDAQLDTPLPIDPGSHVVTATGHGRVFEKQITLDADGATQKIEVPAFGEPTPPPPPLPPRAAPPPPDEEEPSPGHTQRVLGVVTAGAGVIGLGVGAFFGVRSMSKRSTANAECNSSNFCSQSGVDARDEAITSGNISTVGFLAGGVLLIGGVVIYLTAPRSDEASPHARAAVGLRVKPGALLAEGTF